MDIQYLLFLQNLREVTGNVFSDFFSKVTKLGEDFKLMKKDLVDHVF